MVKSSLTPEQLKRAQEIYKIAREKTPMDRKLYLNSLTETERGFYNKEANKQRQKKFNQNAENVVRYNKIRKEYITNERLEEPDKMAKQNLKDVRAFRTREKEQKKQIEAKMKAKQTLSDTIKARKARAELRQLKEEKEKKEKKDIVGDILNSIIDTIPKKSKDKKNREAVARHKAKKATGEPVKIYNTRSKSKA